MFDVCKKFFGNLSFALKLSLVVLIVIFVWIIWGLLFNKKEEDPEMKAVGEGRVTLLASEIQVAQVHKVITGYGNVDRDRIDVISEINSHVNSILKSEGLKVERGEPIIGLLSDVKVPSPITGRLDRINVNRGDIVFAGQTLLFSVISLSKLDVVLHVSASDARYVKPKDEVLLEANDVIYKGEVYFVSKISNKTNNSFEIKIRVKDGAKAEELFHDETIRVLIKTVLKRGFFVPTSAISVTSANETTVTYLDGEKKAKKAKVELLQTFASGIWVSSDELPDSTTIILRGGDFVKEGDEPTYVLEKFEPKYYDI